MSQRWSQLCSVQKVCSADWVLAALFAMCAQALAAAAPAPVQARTCESLFAGPNFALLSVDGDHYEILGIKRNATPLEIKNAYRALVMRYHPDRNHSQNATLEFQRIESAYRTLSDPKKKLSYDWTDPSTAGVPGSRSMSRESLFTGLKRNYPHIFHRDFDFTWPDEYRLLELKIPHFLDDVADILLLNYRSEPFLNSGPQLGEDFEILDLHLETAVRAALIASNAYSRRFLVDLTFERRIAGALIDRDFGTSRRALQIVQRNDQLFTSPLIQAAVLKRILFPPDDGNELARLTWRIAANLHRLAPSSVELLITEIERNSTRSSEEKSLFTVLEQGALRLSRDQTIRIKNFIRTRADLGLESKLSIAEILINHSHERRFGIEVLESLLLQFRVQTASVSLRIVSQLLSSERYNQIALNFAAQYASTKNSSNAALLLLQYAPPGVLYELGNRVVLNHLNNSSANGDEAFTLLRKLSYLSALRGDIKTAAKALHVRVEETEPSTAERLRHLLDRIDSITTL